MGSIFVQLATRRAAQLATKHEQDAIEAAAQNQRGYWDQYLRMFVPITDERHVSAAYAQADTKCKCCGSQEVVHHNKRTICAYCRSNTQ